MSHAQQRATPIVILPDAGRVKEYDPLRHDAIDRARLKRLHPVLDAAAHRMAGVLSATLRRPVQLAVGEAEQGSWDEFRSEMEDPTLIMAASIFGRTGKIVLHIPVGVALVLVDVELGGDGEDQPDRLSLTDLEVSMVSSLAEEMLTNLQPSFDPFLEVGIGALQRYQSGHYVRPDRPGEACFRWPLTMAIGDGTPRSLWLYFPASLVLALLEALERLETGERTDNGGSWPSVERRLLSVSVDVQVSYPPIELTAAELLGVRIGDVIPLHLDKDDKRAQLDIVVGGKAIGKGIFVADGKHRTCAVTSWRQDRRDNQSTAGRSTPKGGHVASPA